MNLSSTRQFLLRKIYDIAYYLDYKLFNVSDYSHETAPYCGHHYSGHKGTWTESSYHEGMGMQYCFFFCWVIYKNTEEKNWYMTTKKIFIKYNKK